jgi:hypothetical protein
MKKSVKRIFFGAMQVLIHLPTGLFSWVANTVLNGAHALSIRVF